MRVLDLFSGIGGFSIAARLAGFETVGFCEIDPYCQKVLSKNFCGVPIHDDIRTLRGDEFGKIDIITAGFPCQDISCAGKGAGLAGANSGLFWCLFDTVCMVRPKHVILENVAAILSRGLSTILGEMAKVGYDSEWHCIPACAIGAPHRRDRCWMLFTNNEDKSRYEADKEAVKIRKGGATWTLPHHGYWQVTPRPSWSVSKSGDPRMDARDRVRIHRNRALGNAIVPQIAYHIFEAIRKG